MTSSSLTRRLLERLRQRRRSSARGPKRIRRLFLERLESRELLAVDVAIQASLAGNLTAVYPVGSLVHQVGYSESLATAGETDDVTISLDAGQTATIVVRPDAALTPTVELLDAGSSVLATATAAAPGSVASLQTIAIPTSGVYTLRVTGASGSTGAYGAELTLNARVEAESLGGTANDSAATAEDLAGSFVGLGVPGAERGAALGGGAPFTGGRMFLYDATSNLIREINPSSGAVISSFATPVSETSGVDYGMATAPNGLLVGGVVTGSIYELDANTGATLRTIPNPGLNISGLAYLGGEIFVLQDTSTVRVLDYQTGAQVRSFTTSLTVAESLTSDGTRLLGTSASGTLYQINATTGVATSLGTLSSTFAPERHGRGGRRTVRRRRRDRGRLRRRHAQL